MQQKGKNNCDSAQYKRNRKRLLRNQPLCQICGIRLAQQADHIKPRHLGGGDEYMNLRAVCVQCHMEITKSQLRELKFKRKFKGW